MFSLWVVLIHCSSTFSSRDSMTHLQMNPVEKIKVISQLDHMPPSHVLAYIASVPHGFSSALAESGWIFFRFNTICAVFQVLFIEVKGLIKHPSAELQYYYYSSRNSIITLSLFNSWHCWGCFQYCFSLCHGLVVTSVYFIWIYFLAINCKFMLIRKLASVHHCL